MMTTRLTIDPHVAEYIRAKYFDEESGAVRFPDTSDVYILIWDLMRKRPADVSPVDVGNLEIVLPDRRKGKDPQYYNYISHRASRLICEKLRRMMWAELHDLMDGNKHNHGIQFKETAYMFLSRYCIESISEDALLKNYQRWRDMMRRGRKRMARKKKV